MKIYLINQFPIVSELKFVYKDLLGIFLLNRGTICH